MGFSEHPAVSPGSWDQAMRLALTQAALAGSRDEVPVGAVVLDAAGHVLAAAHNRTVDRADPAGHAEILALREAAAKAGNHRLMGAVLVVTLEPCLMCVGAMVQARIAGLVFGARDPKVGAVLSCLNVNELHWLNHRFWTVEGVLADDCARILRDFFQARRKGQAGGGSNGRKD